MICPLLDLCDIIEEARKIDISASAGQTEIDLLNELGGRALRYLGKGMSGELGDHIGYLGGDVFNACIGKENFIKRRDWMRKRGRRKK